MSGAPQTYGWDLAYSSTRRSRYERLRAALVNERSYMDAYYRDLADFYAPTRVWFNAGDGKRVRKADKLIDSTARFAARTLQSGMHAGMTNPARPWLRLTTPDPQLAQHGPVKSWLHQVRQIMLTVLIRSNFYQALPTCYLDMGVFGTHAMAILEDERDVIRLYNYPIGSYAIGLDRRGQATTFVREYTMTVRQIVEDFGNGGQPLKRGVSIDWSTISNTVKTLWDKGEYEQPVLVAWLVKPNEMSDSDKLHAKFMPFTSCYWEVSEGKENKFLRESGFRKFSIMAPRWDVAPEDVYGSECPGMVALGDNRQLQVMQREKGKAIKKMIDPPMVAPTTMLTQKVSILPSDVTYVDVASNMAGFRAAHEVRIDINHLMLDTKETQYRIQRAFYEDLFLMMGSVDERGGTQPETARAIDERHEEKLIALSPMYERTNDELLDPAIDRIFDIMVKRQMIPQPPEELRGSDLMVEYISIMAQAQKLNGVASLDRFMISTQALMEAWPQVKHKVRINRVINEYSDMLGAGDPNIVVPDDEAEAAQKAEEEAIAQAQAAEQAATMSKGVRDLAASPLANGGSALDAVASGMGI